MNLCDCPSSPRATSLLDPAGHRHLTDETAAPDLVHRRLLGHHALAVAHQVGEDVEGLRLHRDVHAGPAELEPVDVQLVLAARVRHGGNVSPDEIFRCRREKCRAWSIRWMVAGVVFG
jgi:hypothetical protein